MRKLFAIFVTLFTVSTVFADAVPGYWDGGFRAVYDQLQKNLRPPGKDNSFWHVRPAPKYPGVYLWDSAFISLIWKNKNPAIAEDVIRSVLYNQQKDGRVPHVVSHIGPIKSVSKWTQPPVLSWAAQDILSLSHDVNFATDVYPKLRIYNQWLWKNRRLQNGLFFWLHPYESGIDNSPRFGDRDESHLIDTTHIGAVDLTSYIIMDNKALASMAKFLIENNSKLDRQALEKDIQLFESQAEQTTEALNKNLWDEESGYYFDLDLQTGKLKKIVTVASFFPLTAHAASDRQYLRLREHAVNTKEFNTIFPFPTVSHSDPTFEKDMWRGAVWINTSFLVIRGIKQYGDQNLVRYLSQHLVDSVYKVWSLTGTFFEFYDPDRYDFVQVTRKKGSGFLGLQNSPNPISVIKHLFLKQLLLGTKPVDHFIGWTGLVNTLAIEELGFEPTK
jgi:glycogen debranching enzyme